MAREVTFEIVEELEVLSEGRNGWTKEVNLVRWNNGQVKVDIREWNEDKSKMGKGVTLSYDEYELLKEALNKDLDF